MSRENRAGYTLIELMTVVVTLGALAAIAVPTFTLYARKSKTSEVFANLRLMYNGAATYTQMDYFHEGPAKGRGSGSGTGAMWGFSQWVRCSLPSSSRIPATPTAEKQVGNFDGDPVFEALNFRVSEPIYYAYQVQGMGSAMGTTIMGMGMGVGGSASLCMISAGPAYTFSAVGDLDGDGVRSTFELSAGYDERLSLYRSPGFFANDEFE